MASTSFSERRLITLHSKLTAWWKVIQNLRLDSPPEDWNAFSSYLSPNCTVYLNGMNAEPCKGRDSTAQHMKRLLGYWAIKERRVLSQGLDPGGRIIMASLLNALLIRGELLDLPEAEVVEFDDEGRILEYKLYADPQPIMAIMRAKANSEGN
ncbi:hypothetical protein BJX66DRAFT_332145 [Aspergillus keveii]|uniref:SnoaL-like domain-containing protein n=1 Tax=Aspergillus keveii TaxID=714993 RepID=A0ABR4GNY6_9EURO